jgi:hypothetical protein
MTISRKLVVTMLFTIITLGVAGKAIQPKHVYMFGFSASFKDSTVYITDIQDVQGAWIDTKTNFLLNRDLYSIQLREYLADKQQQPGRVCVVMFATDRKKAEKKLRKFKKMYVEKGRNSYAVRQLTAADFRFSSVSDEEFSE